MAHEPRKCRAMSKRSGEQCKRWAIPGGLVCHMHGGSIGHVKAAAKRRLALAEAQELANERKLEIGTEVDVDGETGLYAMLSDSAVMVAIYRDLVSTLKIGFGPDALAGPTGSMSKLREAAPHVYVTMYDRERDRFAQVSKLAIEAGLTERMVRIQETLAERMVQAFALALDDDELGLTAIQRKTGRQVLGRHLNAV